MKEASKLKRELSQMLEHLDKGKQAQSPRSGESERLASSSSAASGRQQGIPGAESTHFTSNDHEMPDDARALGLRSSDRPFALTEHEHARWEAIHAFGPGATKHLQRDGCCVTSVASEVMDALGWVQRQEPSRRGPLLHVLFRLFARATVEIAAGWGGGFVSSPDESSKHSSH